MKKPSMATRAYLYRVAGGIGLVVGGYGLMSDAKVALWLGLVSTVLGNGLAAANTSTSKG